MKRLVALCVVWFATLPHATAGSPPRIVLKTENGKAGFEVVGLSTDQLARLGKANLNSDQWNAVFAVRVSKPDEKGISDRPAMLGEYRLDEGKVRFLPRFPLSPGVRYQAVLDRIRIPGEAGKPASIVEVFAIPKPEAKPTTIVEQVYPTRDVLPENHLKFYILFSAPMSRGEAYRNLQLLDAKGKPIEFVFLELGEELWTAEGTRFTLFFDPGRVKKGLKPREDLGPVLEEGKSYTLVIQKEWQDAQGNPLKASFRKSIRVGPADEQAIDHKTWKVEAPKARTKTPVRVQFPESLDYALIHRMIWVADRNGDLVEGTIKVSEHETRWEFVPAMPWQAGEYQIQANTSLEDLAGNKIGQLFEVDEFRPIQRRLESRLVSVPFKVSN